MLYAALHIVRRIARSVVCMRSASLPSQKSSRKWGLELNVIVGDEKPHDVDGTLGRQVQNRLAAANQRAFVGYFCIYFLYLRPVCLFASEAEAAGSQQTTQICSSI